MLLVSPFVRAAFIILGSDMSALRTRRKKLFSRKIVILSFACFMAIVLCAGYSNANTVLFSNLGPNGEFDGTQGRFVNGDMFDGAITTAMPFTPSVSMKIGDAALALVHHYGTESLVTVYLEADNNGAPGSVLESLNQAGDVTDVAGLVTFNSSAGTMLQAGVQYWIVAVAASDSFDYWMFTDPYLNGIMAYSSDMSPTPNHWNVFYAYDSVSAFRVDGADSTPASVPEPASILLFSTGIVGIGLAAWRKRK
jgi:hypothetical protein